MQVIETDSKARDLTQNCRVEHRSHAYVLHGIKFVGDEEQSEN